MSHVTCHLSSVTCHLSRVTCHMSHVTNANSQLLLTLPLYTIGWFAKTQTIFLTKNIIETLQKLARVTQVIAEPSKCNSTNKKN